MSFSQISRVQTAEGGAATGPRRDAVWEEWRRIVGTEHVLTSERDIEPYRYATIPVERTISAIVRPGCTAEVQRLVHSASRHGVPLYPVSTGRNWGYGSANPVNDHNAIVDLSRMCGIQVNQELAYAVIEPGVTQQQLFQHLQERAIPLWIDPTGAGPHVSIAGNAIERGYGITPYGDHFAQMCGLDVVLPNGELLKTGFGHYENATRVFPRGPGPLVDGLFTQSSLGIVTRMGVWLMPQPEYFELCVFSADKDEQLGALVERVRRLLLDGTVRSSINLLHRDRVLTVARSYPWDETNGLAPLPNAVAQRIAHGLKIGAWSGIAGLYGSRAQVRADRQAIRRAFRGVADQLYFISERRLKWMERLAPWMDRVAGTDLQRRVAVIRPTFGILQGVPNAVSLRTAFWRSRETPAEVPSRLTNEPCGLIWFSPVLPMTSAAVEEFRSIASPILSKYGFECCITLTSVNPRAFDCTLPILFDRADPAECAKADDCYNELFERCGEAGYLPYRVGIQSMDRLRERSQTYWSVCDRIKSALDPLGIISPGRYQPSVATPVRADPHTGSQ